MNTKISNQYSWLETLPDAPLMIKEAIRIGKLNTNEIPGTKSNPEIMKLAEIAGVKHIYKNDDIAWCAVAQSAICLLANKELPFTGYDRSNIRRLTEIECERLQGFPDNWTMYGIHDGVIKKISKTQRYGMLGNAVTVNVVCEVAKRLLKINSE